MKINFTKVFLCASLLCLAACASIKTADTSCIADNAHMLHACTGCPSVTEGSGLECLAYDQNGEIYVDYDACRHTELTFDEKHSCNSVAVLVAHTYGAPSKSAIIPYGVDRVMRPQTDSDYYVFATNRENDGYFGFGTVQRVSLGGDSSDLEPFIAEGGFGGLSEFTNSWYFVPYADKVADLHLITLDPFGAQTDDYAFGATLAKADPKLGAMTNMDFLNGGEIALSFTKDGVTESKGGPFALVVLSPSEKKLYTLQQR